jgi:hypothetical protein
VRARPRVWLGSREAEEGLWLSIWCDTFPTACRACRSGKGAAAADTADVSTTSERGRNVRPARVAHTACHGTSERAGFACPRRGWSSVFHGGSHGVPTNIIQTESQLTHAANLAWRIVWGSRRRLRAVRSGGGCRWRRERTRCLSWTAVVMVGIPRTPAPFLDASAHWWLHLRCRSIGCGS